MKIEKIDLVVGYIQGGASLDEAIKNAYKVKGRELQKVKSELIDNPDYQLAIKSQPIGAPVQSTALDRTRSGKTFTREQRLDVIIDIAFNGEKDADRLKAVDLANKMDVQEVEVSALELAMTAMLSDVIDLSPSDVEIDINTKLDYDAS